MREEKIDSPADHAPTWAATARETIESIVIAFVLAFLFRTFEAEAFVIPTGSMAPTLQGRHKDLHCPQCGFQYRVGATEGAQVPSLTCPMCNFAITDPKSIQGYPSYNGDRILVDKFAFDLGEPQRWDVVVFKYPEDAKTNYIKRLVGLPGETIKIQHGDIYVSRDGGKTFGIARKESPQKLSAMLQNVYDNDFVVEKLLEAGFPARWQDMSGGGNGWTSQESTRSFSSNSEGKAELRYQHFVPTDEQWRDVEKGRNLSGSIDPSLIKDAYAYNGGGTGRYFVGDLALNVEAEVRKAAGTLTLELVKGGRAFQARIDLATGEARLSIVGAPDFNASASTKVSAEGTYQLQFSNVDGQLSLMVDGERIAFPGEGIYPASENSPTPIELAPGLGRPTDLSPVGVLTENADVQVSHLNIRRDVYYTEEWRVIASDRGEPHGEITLEDSADDDRDQFFMLGDNSPASKDSRLWDTVHSVERRLLIGKAYYVYWPHSWPAKWGIPFRFRGNEFTIPFWPNFERMRRIR